MKKRFIITESERDQIRKMYGLIKEGAEQIREIEAYTTEYLNAKSDCDGIAQDVKNLYAAVNNPDSKVLMSPAGKAKLEENMSNVKLIGGFTCGIAKNKIKQEFDEEKNNESNHPDMIVTACWMAENSVRYTKSLSICNQAPVQDQNNNQNYDQNNQFQNQNINLNLSNNDVDLSTMRDYNQINTQNQNTTVQRSELDDFIQARGGGSKSSGRTLDLK